MSYELTKDEKETISEVGILSFVLATLIIIGGIMDFFIAINQLTEEGSGTIFGFVVIVLVQLVIGAVLYLPANNFRKIKYSKGNDIEILMDGIEKLLVLTKVIIGGLLVSLMILIFSFSLE